MARIKGWELNLADQPYSRVTKQAKLYRNLKRRSIVILVTKYRQPYKGEKREKWHGKWIVQRMDYATNVSGWEKHFNSSATAFKFARSWMKKHPRG